MENIVIVVILLLIVGIAIVPAVRHLKGQGKCCGGTGFKPKKKKLSGVLYEKTFRVEGMHCEHCKGRVEEVVNDITGIAGRVNLKKGELTILYAQDVPDEQIIARLEKAGYRAEILA